MKMQAKLVTATGITVILDGKPYSVGTEHPNYNEILKTLKNDEVAKFLKLYGSSDVKVEPSYGIQATPSIVVGRSSVTYNGMPLHNVVVNRILDMQAINLDIKPITLFLEKLLTNPSKWCVDSLYKFMESKGLPITSNGNVLGYKVVTKDWKDKWTDTIDNSIGTQVPILDRFSVDDDRTKECSFGYHIGNLNYSGPNGSYYSKSAGDRIIIVEFSPADVVSVPENAAANKIRVVTYKVISEYKEDLDDTYSEYDSCEQGECDCCDICANCDETLNVCMCEETPLTIYDLTPGNKISFDYNNVEVHLKFEGRNKRYPDFIYGRLIAGTHYGLVGRSASFDKKFISNIKIL